MTSVEENSSYEGTGTSPDSSAARARGRLTGARRTPRVTEPRSRPWRTAGRSGSCLPSGPHTALTSSSNIAAITCRPSRVSAAISFTATVTCSGTGRATRVDLVLLVGLAHGGPVPVSRGVLGGSPETYHPVGLRCGTATSQLPQDPGQTSLHHTPSSRP